MAQRNYSERRTSSRDPPWTDAGLSTGPKWRRASSFGQCWLVARVWCISQTAPVGYRSSDRRPVTICLLATTLLSAVSDRKRGVEMRGDPDDDDRRIHIYSAAHSQGAASAAHTGEKRACRVTRRQQGMPSRH